MGRLALGDRSAFEPLFRGLHPRARRFARARLALEVADDVAQSALLRVFANAHRFQPGRPALPWFYAIVANEIRAARRKGAASQPHAPHHPEPEDAGPEDALLTQELHRVLHAAVAALDDASAEAIRALLDERERPALEAATFRKRVSRAYARLRILLGEFR